MQNNGPDDAVNSQLVDAVQTGFDDVPRSLKIDGVSRTDATGDDTGSFVRDANQGEVIANIGAGATTGGTIPADAGVTVPTVVLRAEDVPSLVELR